MIKVVVIILHNLNNWFSNRFKQWQTIRNRQVREQPRMKVPHLISEAMKGLTDHATFLKLNIFNNITITNRILFLQLNYLKHLMFLRRYLSFWLIFSVIRIYSTWVNAICLILYNCNSYITSCRVAIMHLYCTKYCIIIKYIASTSDT